MSSVRELAVQRFTRSSAWEAGCFSPSDCGDALPNPFLRLNQSAPGFSRSMSDAKGRHDHAPVQPSTKWIHANSHVLPQDNCASHSGNHQIHLWKSRTWLKAIWCQKRHQPIVLQCFYLSILACIPLKTWVQLSELVLPCPSPSTNLGWIFRGMENAGNEQAFFSIRENCPRR